MQQVCAMPGIRLHNEGSTPWAIIVQIFIYADRICSGHLGQNIHIYSSLTKNVLYNDFTQEMLFEHGFIDNGQDVNKNMVNGIDNDTKCFPNFDLRKASSATEHHPWYS